MVCPRAKEMQQDVFKTFNVQNITAGNNLEITIAEVLPTNNPVLTSTFQKTHPFT